MRPKWYSSPPRRRPSKPCAHLRITQFMSTKRTVVAVIDDNLAILGAMGRLLSAYGYATELYASAKEFLEAAMTTGAICLIIDVHLGESCGIELAQQLANAGFSIPIIFMTADDNGSLRTRAMEIGCVAVLRKPFSSDALLGALADLSPRGAARFPLGQR